MFCLCYFIILFFIFLFFIFLLFFMLFFCCGWLFCVLINLFISFSSIFLPARHVPVFCDHGPTYFWWPNVRINNTTGFWLPPLVSFFPHMSPIPWTGGHVVTDVYSYPFLYCAAYSETPTTTRKQKKRERETVVTSRRGEFPGSFISPSILVRIRRCIRKPVWDYGVVWFLRFVFFYNGKRFRSVSERCVLFWKPSREEINPRPEALIDPDPTLTRP